MVTQTSSSATVSATKTTTATPNSSSTSSSLCMAASSSSSSSTASSGSPYLKPVNIVSSAVGGAKNALGNNLSAAGAASAGKKVIAPKINFVGG